MVSCLRTPFIDTHDPLAARDAQNFIGVVGLPIIYAVIGSCSPAVRKFFIRAREGDDRVIATSLGNVGYQRADAASCSVEKNGFVVVNLSKRVSRGEICDMRSIRCDKNDSLLERHPISAGLRRRWHRRLAYSAYPPVCMSAVTPPYLDGCHVTRCAYPFHGSRHFPAWRERILGRLT